MGGIRDFDARGNTLNGNCLTFHQVQDMAINRKNPFRLNLSNMLVILSVVLPRQTIKEVMSIGCEEQEILDIYDGETKEKGSKSQTHQ